mmetsp:Transcript_27342/g.63756  ORF Transcript_27342/g.63756 Transcript_27342/m.63756 type:complete len:853 (-) Transcript_27342:50-2608(-)
MNHVRIDVIEARKLRAADSTGTSDPYVIIRHVDGLVGIEAKTKVVPRNCNPTWNESFNFNFNHKLSHFKFIVYDKDTLSEDDLLGKLVIPLQRFYTLKNEAGARVLDEWFPLGVGSTKKWKCCLNKKLGELRVRITVRFRMALAVPGTVLTADAKRLAIGLSWHFGKHAHPGGPVDLDASAVGLDSHFKVLDYVHYDHLTGFKGGLRHSGDSRDGGPKAGQEDILSSFSEAIFIDVDKMPKECTFLFIVVNSYNGQALATVKDASCTLVATDSKEVISGYSMYKNVPNCTGMFFAILVRGESDSAFDFVTMAAPADGRFVNESLPRCLELAAPFRKAEVKSKLPAFAPAPRRTTRSSTSTTEDPDMAATASTTSSQFNNTAARRQTRIDMRQGTMSLASGGTTTFDSEGAGSARSKACKQGTDCDKRNDADHMEEFAHPLDADYEAACKACRMEPEPLTLRTVFKWVDADKSGKITVQELEEALPTLTALDCADQVLSGDAWAKLDEDGNGVVNFSEFAQWAGPRFGLPLGVSHLFASNKPGGSPCRILSCPCEAYREKRLPQKATTAGCIIVSHSILCECGHGKRHHAFAREQDGEVPYPEYWQSTGSRAMALVSEDKENIAVFQAILNDTYRNVWTRDRRKHNPSQPNVPKGFIVTKVMRAENGSNWQEYSVKRAEMQQDVAKAKNGDLRLFEDVKSTAAWKRAVGDNSRSVMASEVNEWFLFHGCSEEVAKKICMKDFLMARELVGKNTGTLYGRGTYFAESITKADEYARPNDNGEYTVLFVRALGGRVKYTDEVTPDSEALVTACISGEHDCVLGDREKCRGTFREFVFFDTENLYAEYIIYYKRSY